MLHGIVVGLHHTILDHVLPAKLITLHDIAVGQGQGLELGWGGGSWGWAFSFLCFDIVECAHGHSYAKQVRIMCVLSVPLLDQVSGVLKAILEVKNMLNTYAFEGFDNKHQK